MQFQHSLSFSKYSGCGNDFILIDNRKNIFPSKNDAFISRLCHRSLGIGADGLILLEVSDKAGAKYKMRYFNADGFEAAMCGNGLRCLGRFLEELKLTDSNEIRPIPIEISEHIYPVFLHKDQTVSVKMPSPTAIEWDIPIKFEEQKGQLCTNNLKNCLRIDFLNTGVPHSVLEVKNISFQDLQKLGPSLRNHPRFSPEGTNVNLYSRSSHSPSELHVRTYERGVEKETLACGTGGAACAVAAWKKYGGHFFRAHFLSKEHIDYEIESEKDTIKSLLMRGPATFVFRGTL